MNKTLTSFNIVSLVINTFVPVSFLFYILKYYSCDRFFSSENKEVWHGDRSGKCKNAALTHSCVLPNTFVKKISRTDTGQFRHQRRQQYRCLDIIILMMKKKKIHEVNRKTICHEKEKENSPQIQGIESYIKKKQRKTNYCNK